MAYVYVTFFNPDDSIPGQLVFTPGNFTFEEVSYDDITHGVTIGSVVDGMEYVLIEYPDNGIFYYDIGPSPEATVGSPVLVMVDPLSYRILKLQAGDKISFLETAR